MTAQHPLLLRVVWACPLLKETSSGKSPAGSHREIQKKYAIEGLTLRGSTMRAGTTLEKSKMNELVKLRQQIADMEKQAADLQKKTRPAVLAELREQMAAYGITAEELSRPAAKPKAASLSKGKKPAVPSPTKYRGPQGQAWSGRGNTPRWLNDLLVDGKTREDFLIRQDTAV